MRELITFALLCAVLPLAAKPLEDRYSSILAIADPEKRLSEWNAFAAKLPEAEIAPWLRQAESLPEWRDRAVLQLALLRQWGSHNPLSAAQFTETLPPGRFQVECLNGILRQWASQNPKAAAAYVKRLTPDKAYRQIAVNCVVEQWAGASPEDALKWVEHLEDTVRNEGLNTLLFVWVHQDPVRAWEKIKTLPAGNTRQMLVTNAALAWAKKDPLSAIAWAQQLPVEEERQLAQGAIAEGWSGWQPLKAAQFSLTLPQSSMRADVISAVISNWALQNPAAVGNWLAAQSAHSFPEETAALRSLMNIWADRDPTSAARWIASLSPGDFRDAAIQHFVAPAARWAPGITADLALTISSVPLRQSALNICLQQWQRLDEPAMRAWLAKNRPARESVSFAK